MEVPRTGSLHSRLAENYRAGRVTITLNRGAALFAYPRVTRNPLVKIFQGFVSLVSSPLFILCSFVTFVFFERYLWIPVYIVLFSLLLLAERVLAGKILIGAALKDENTCRLLLQKGVISIRDRENPDAPL